ncbi:MAG: phosphate ABC transporter permease PtsA [Archaeoglobi archaeon]|nr:MAG: phosphate ABC transporter permease PtsA [Archaeoglobi archaeon]
MYRRLKDDLFVLFAFASALLAILPIFHILFSVFYNGIPVLAKYGVEFLSGTLPPPNKAGGGVFPAIYGSLTMIVLSLMLGIPLGVFAGVFIAEYPSSSISKAARTVLVIILEFPTILVGLFVMAVMVIPMGRFSAIAGAFALTIVMLPYVATYTEQAIRSVPQHYKEVGFALGLNRFRIVFSITLRIAKKVFITGLLIGMAKVSGETAPLIFTAGNVWRSTGALNEPAGAIPLWIYYLVQQPYSNYHEIAWGAAVVLLAIFLVIFLSARLMVRS